MRHVNPMSGERRELLDQLELHLGELEESQAQAVMALDKVSVQSFDRRKPARRPLPEHLPRERVVYRCRPPFLLRRG